MLSVVGAQPELVRRKTTPVASPQPTFPTVAVTVAVPAWLSELLGGLPHHSVHHAFPALPTAALPEATERVEAVLRAYGYPPLPRCKGYGEAFQLLG